MKIKKTAFLLFSQCLLVSTLGFSLMGCKDDIAKIGQTAPDIAAFDLQGNKVNLADWKGKNIVLSFWSDTCGACVAELKEMQNLAEKHPQSNVAILAINIDGEKADTQSVVTEREITLPVAKDQLNISAERYRVMGTPTSFIIDPAGKLLQKYEGPIPNEDLNVLFKQ